jgi:hypothetical protein
MALPIAMDYGLTTLHGQAMRKSGVDIYAGRINEHKDKTLRQSDFSLGVYGQRWMYGMELWHDWALRLEHGTVVQ